MRINIPTGGSVRLMSMADGFKGFSIQNVGAVDIYISDDQRLLDSADLTNLPTVGHLLPAATPALPLIVFQKFRGNLFARSQGAGAQLEIMVFDVRGTKGECCE